MIGYGAFLIAVLVLVSGVIAYVGDVLGRWLGRRRVTIFGMRPRHTAMVISVFVGMLIAAWTIGVSMAVSKDVRDGLTRVVALRRQIGRLKGSAAVLARQNKALNDQQEVLRREADSSRKAEQQARADREKAEKAAAAAEKALSRADRELARRQARLAEVRRELARTEKELLNATRAAIKQGNQLRALEAERASLEAEIRELTGWRARAISTFGHIYTAPLIAEAGEPLLDAMVDAGAGKAEIRRALDSFVDRLESVAKGRGAEGSGDHGPVIVKLLIADQESKKVALYEEDAVLDLLAQAIAEMGGSVIVRALSLGNTVKGEAILVDFQLFKNRQVFKQGEVIAEATIDGAVSEAKVLGALVDLLRNEVGMRARQQGVLPALQRNPETRPLFPAPSMPVGEVSMESLLSLSDQIRQKGGPVRVTARAAADTWTAGPLGVELSVAAS